MRARGAPPTPRAPARRRQGVVRDAVDLVVGAFFPPQDPGLQPGPPAPGRPGFRLVYSSG